MRRRLAYKYPIYRLLWYDLIVSETNSGCKKTMKRAGVIIIGLFLLAGCSKPKVQYGEIYQSDHGTNEVYYTRSYSGGSFW
jgi:hypothetical protein